MAELVLLFEVDHHVGQVSLSVLPGCNLCDLGSHSKHSTPYPAGVEVWSSPGLAQPLLCCYDRIPEAGNLEKETEVCCYSGCESTAPACDKQK